MSFAEAFSWGFMAGVAFTIGMKELGDWRTRRAQTKRTARALIDWYEEIHRATLNPKDKERL